MRGRTLLDTVLGDFMRLWQVGSAFAMLAICGTHAVNAGPLTGAGLTAATPTDYTFIHSNGVNVYNGDQVSARSVRGSLGDVDVTTGTGTVTVWTNNNGGTQTCKAVFKNAAAGLNFANSVSVTGTGYFSY